MALMYKKGHLKDATRGY